MVEVYLDLDTTLKIMITTDNYIVLYDTFQYNGQTLDKLFEIMSNVKPDRALVVTHAVYDTTRYNAAYHPSILLIGDFLYTGNIAQIDINKLMHLFNSLKITNVEFFDKFQMYSYISADDVCIIDSCNKSYVLTIKQKDIRDIVYVKEQNLEQAMLQLCRKHNITEMCNLTNYIEYDYVKYFENYTDLAEIDAFVTASVFGFFRFVQPDLRYDITCVTFDRNMNTVTYDDSSSETKGTTENSTESQDDLTTDKNLKNANKGSKGNSKRLKKRRNRDSKSAGIMAATISIVLVALSLIVFCVLSVYFRQIELQKQNSYNIASEQKEHAEHYIAKLKENVPMDYGDVVNYINSICPIDDYVGSIVIDDTYEVLFYVAESSSIDEIQAVLKNDFEINGISDGGVITLNDKNYAKYTISITYKQSMH